MSQATRILLSLVIGLLAGIGSAAIGGIWVEQAASIAEPIGRMWLAGLQMTIVPLVVALLVTGIAATAEAARAGRLAGRALITFLVILWFSATLGALLTPALLDIFPLARESADALRTALTTTGVNASEAVPSIADFLSSIVPTNPIAAAANDNFLPLIVFTSVFAFALTQLPPEPRERLTGFFQALADVMLVVIGWVLWIGPIGVFALAYVVGARAGGAAFGALLHYVLIVTAAGTVIWLLSFAVARFGAGISLGRFIKASAPAQAVAISTQSSLATLPAMLRCTETLKVPVAASGVVLPLAVALFRATGPAMNVAVAFYVAHWYGIEVQAWQAAAGIAVAATTTLGSVSLPGQVSFITAIAPIAMAMGVPVEPLAVLIAVEVLPDIMRTLGNVTMDMAVTASVSKRSGFTASEATSDQDRLLGSDG